MGQTFDEILDEVLDLWHDQKKKAMESEVKIFEFDCLIAECEKIEEKILELLTQAKEINPDAYNEFIQSFAMVSEEQGEI